MNFIGEADRIPREVFSVRGKGRYGQYLFLSEIIIHNR